MLRLPLFLTAPFRLLWPTFQASTARVCAVKLPDVHHSTLSSAGLASLPILVLVALVVRKFYTPDTHLTFDSKNASRMLLCRAETIAPSMDREHMSNAH